MHMLSKYCGSVTYLEICVNQKETIPNVIILLNSFFQLLDVFSVLDVLQLTSLSSTHIPITVILREFCRLGLEA